MELTLNYIRHIRGQVLQMVDGQASQQLPIIFNTGSAFLKELTSTVELQRKHKQVKADYPLPESLELALQNCFLVLAGVIGLQALNAMILASPTMAGRIALDYGSGRMELIPRDPFGVEMGEIPVMFETFGMILGTFGYEAFPGENGEGNMVQFLDGVAVGYSGHMNAMNQFKRLREQVPRVIN